MASRSPLAALALATLAATLFAAVPACARTVVGLKGPQGRPGLLLAPRGATVARVDLDVASRVGVRVRATSCAGSAVVAAGPPSVRRRVDTRWQEVTLPKPLARGRHAVTIRDVSGAGARGCARRLAVDALIVDPVPVGGGAAPAAGSTTPATVDLATPTVADPAPAAGDGGGSGPPAAPAPPPSPSPAPAPVASPNPLAGRSLYREPDGPAQQQADAWRVSRPADAALMDEVAGRPQAIWLGDWTTDVRAEAQRITTAAAQAGTVPVLVAYDIPDRDCGGQSAGGAGSADAYRAWIRALAGGIASRAAVVIVEPDAIAGMDCLDAAGRATRLELLRDAVDVLAARPGVATYLDAGHSGWHGAADTAARLVEAGVARARGFSLNVSNFRATETEAAYGAAVRGALGGTAGFVIDTSRNGLGPTPDNAWCNPDGRALGRAPTTDTGIDGLDALLWIKHPGQSDGACNGGPSAGTWWPEYALGLAGRAA